MKRTHQYEINCILFNFSMELKAMILSNLKRVWLVYHGFAHSFIYDALIPRN